MTSQVVHFKKSRYDVYIGRGSKWGNPYSHLRDSMARWVVGTRDDAIAMYEIWLKEQPELMAALPELRGKVLGCWCAPKRCHGEVLVRLANDHFLKSPPELSTENPGGT